MVCDIHSVLLKYYQVSLSSCLVMHSGKLNIHAHSHGNFFYFCAQRTKAQTEQKQIT